MQEFLKKCVLPEELLKINESVKEALDSITRLEAFLQAKLDLVSCKLYKH